MGKPSTRLVSIDGQTVLPIGEAPVLPSSLRHRPRSWLIPAE
jgi:hypothetical protein